MPVELIGSRVADMVVNSCLSSSSSPNTSSSLASLLQAAINGTANRVDESVLLDQWTTMSKSVLNQIEVASKLVLWLASSPTDKKKVDSAILIHVIDRTNLTSTINDRLNHLSQIAMYTDFLKSQISDKVYEQARDQLTNITSELSRALCTVKQLLTPPLSNDVLRTYVTDNCNKADLAQALVGLYKSKRKVTYYVLELTKKSLVSRLNKVTSSALTFAMPVELIGSRVADMVVNSCQSSSSSPNTSSSLPSAMQAAINGTANRVDESVLLDQWMTMSKSVLNQVAGVLSNFSLWNTSSLSLKQTVAGAVKINVIDRTNLTATINSRLGNVSQIAMYADLFKSQMSDVAYGQARDQLTNITSELSIILCTVKQLLTPVLSNDVLRTYVTENCNKADLAQALVGQTGSLKRAVTYYVLELTRNSLAQI
nr:hypothetical protein BgiMline_001210 [Biomphalaria glabrata]